MVFDDQDYDGHEQIVFCSEVAVGLSAIIAIHSTALGPAAGGCRMHPYESETAALTDVLRLSKGMSYKNALAGLPLGGGKAVIIGDPSSPTKPELLRAFARHVQSLAGRYWTAIDVGVGPVDADVLAEQCDYTFARASQYEPGFNPSAFTARGGFAGIRAGVAHVSGSDDLAGVRVAIQGLGATGSRLAELLHGAGAQLIVADVNKEAVADVVSRFGADAVAPEEIHAQDVDVFAPCAFGAVLNDRTVPEVRAGVVCGLANNQLAEPRHGRALRERGIAYVPDYVVNAGGVMGAATIIYGSPSREESLAKIDALYETIGSILRGADELDRSTSDIADDMALARINTANDNRLEVA
ncbi:MAG: Leu/Phe/Val dehydrogenase [Acidimicrobiales bacterium]